MVSSNPSRNFHPWHARDSGRVRGLSRGVIATGTTKLSNLKFKLVVHGMVATQASVHTTHRNYRDSGVTAWYVICILHILCQLECAMHGTSPGQARGKRFCRLFLQNALAKKNYARAGISRDCGRARISQDCARFPPAHWFFASYMMTHHAKMCNINHIPLAYFVLMFLFNFHPLYLVKGGEQIVLIQHWLKDFAWERAQGSQNSSEH